MFRMYISLKSMSKVIMKNKISIMQTNDLQPVLHKSLNFYLFSKYSHIFSHDNHYHSK